MKHRVALRIMLIGFCLVLAGCDGEVRKIDPPNGLRIDHRYKTEIAFDIIDVVVKIEKPDAYVRIDGPVADMDRHLSGLLDELQIFSANITYANPADKYDGQHMHMSFDDGKECGFIWFIELHDERLTRAVVEHEKFHALSRLAPSGNDELSSAIRRNGFAINLSDYEEELAATIVQALSLYLQGVPFEAMSGSSVGNHARQILLDNMSNEKLDLAR